MKPAVVAGKLAPVGLRSGPSGFGSATHARGSKRAPAKPGQIETKKKLAISTMPTVHTNERNIAQSAR